MLEFNTEKCAIVHVGHRNPGFINKLNRKDLKRFDLGVLVTSVVEPAEHIVQMAAKVNRMVSFIQRNFSYMDDEMCK